MSFPISITWSGGAPPVAGFQQMAAAAAKLDTSLQTTVGKMDQFGSSISQIEGPIGGVASGVGQLESSIGGLEGSIGGAASGMESFAGSTESLNGSISETGGFVTDATGSMSDFGGAATDAGGAATEFGTASTDAGSGVTELGTASTDAGGFVTELGTATGETNTVLGETNTVLGETVPAMAETATGAADTTTAFTDLNPAVTDTTGALDSGIPIFEGAGTAAADAGAATDTFSGALSGMADPLEGVTGGLDTNNTLMENLATSTGDTNTESGNLSGTLTTLGTGIGTVTGSAMSLYSAYTNVRDAQAAVDKAQTKIITTNKAAESSFIKLGGAVNKLTSDTENHITGQGRLAAAWQKVVDLWNAGVRSGPQLAAALNELKAAQDGMTSSTAKGNEMIAKLNPQISTFEANARKAGAAQLGLTRANEGLVESMIGVAGSLVSGVSGLVQIATQGGAAFRALGPLKGVFIDMGIVLSQSVIPALAGIAAPAAVAVAAVVGFIAAVEAIRANLKVFDEMGVAIGTVFPQLKGFLDDGRQAFINFSDGLNTGISMLLGGFDSLTGGVFGAQKAWDGFTGTLPKGTGEIGLAAKATNLWTLSMTNSADKIRVGAGKWKEADGVLMRLNGSVLAAAGTWDVLADGTAVYLKSAQPVPGTLDKTAQAADKAGTSTTQMSEATKKASDELAGIGTAVEEANAKFAFYGDSAKLAELMTSSFALGVAEAKVELIDETAELAKGAGALQEHSRQLAEGSIQAIAYKQGILEAGEALVKKVQALEQARGAYDATNVLIKEGTLLAVEFAAGMQETKSAIQEETQELANLAGQLEAYSDKMTAANAIQNAFVKGMLEQRKAGIDAALGYAEAVGKLTELEKQMGSAMTKTLAFNTGLVEGRTKALEFSRGLTESAAESIAFEATLRKLAVAAGTTLQNAFSMSESQLKDFLGAMALAPEAVNKVISAFDKMGQKIVDSLSKAAQKGSKEFMDEIHKMEQEMGVVFSKEQVQKFRLEANIETAKQQVQGLLGSLATMVRNQPIDVALKTTAAQQTLAQLQAKIKEAAAAGATGFGPLQSALNKLATTNFSGSGITQLPGILAQIVSASANLEGGMQGAMTSLNGFFQQVASGAGGMDALKKAFENVGFAVQANGDIVDTATKQIIGNLNTMATGATGSAATTVTALDTLGPAGTRARTTLAYEMVGLTFLIDKFAQETKQSAIEVSTAFANMSANTRTSMATMASGFQIVIAALTRIQTDSQRMASTVSGSFSNMANNTRSSMNTMASGFQIILAAMTRASSDAQRMNTTVSSAMSSMSSRVTSFGSAFQSSMNRLISSANSGIAKVKQLQAAINALKSKTVVLTTIHRQVVQRVYAAQGGSFIQSNPGRVGPLNVSEFGQQELVTVTPLQSPGRQPIKGLSDLIGKETAKKAKRAMGEEVEKEGKGKQKEVVMMRETPIIIQVDGREIARVVNKRIFEESDALV